MSAYDNFRWCETAKKKMERRSGSFLRKALSSLKEAALFDIWYPGVLNAVQPCSTKGCNIS